MTKNKKVYIIGCMGNKKDLGYAQFEKTKLMLQEKHPEWTIISPADIDQSVGMSAEKFHNMIPTEKDAFLHSTILLDLNEIHKCDAVFHMSGWRESMGFCYVEHWYARRMGKEIMFEDGEDSFQFKKHGFRGDIQ